jgi:diguanylate cyclase (GGDEF)-like protein
MEKMESNYGFRSIRNRILIFSVLVTLIPSFGMGWLLNNMMHATLTEKIEQKLFDSANIIEREVSLWFKERSYDLYVFSTSFVITENFTKYLDADPSKVEEDAGVPVYIRTIETYLTSVQKQFEDYTRLFVLNNDGSIVAASDTADKDLPIHLPKDTANQIGAAKYITGEVYFDDDNGTPLMLIGIPLFSGQYGEHVGILAIEVRLQGIRPLLQAALIDSNADTQIAGSLIRLTDGRHFLSSNNSAEPSSSVTASDDVMRLFEQAPQLQDFTNHEGVRVVGILTSLKQLKWGLVIAENYKDVFARLISSRDRNILVVCSFGLLIGLAAYLFARQIIIPLTALTKGAQQVAIGDLDVCLPIQKNDELGFATEVFNKMVAELQQSQAELERLATTDALTMLANRKQIMQNLRNHFDHFQRYSSEFSILMIDADNFKKINDTYGHLAGDAVLRKMAEILLETIRNVDMAGRYGGEEFLVILADSSGEKAQQAAERIREAINEHTFTYENSSVKVNVSIGVARITKEDENESSLINRADKALYQAKGNGRDQVVFIDDNSPEEAKVSKVISLPRSA